MVNGASPWPWTASLLAHAGLLAAGLAWSRRPIAHAPMPAPVTVEIEPATLAPSVPSRIDPTGFVRADAPPAESPPAPAQPVPLGGARAPQNVAAANPGDRGDGRSPSAGRRLAQRAEGVDLSPTLMNTLDLDQEQRLHTARDRTSPQDRRSTPHPGYDPWIASSDGVLLFRAPASPHEPTRGARVADGRAIAAGAASPPPASTGETGQPALRIAPGAAPRPGAGVDAAAHGHTTAARGVSATGHASILEGHASTTSDFAAPQPRDDADAEALASNLLRNALAATVHAGPERADGVGGIGGGGAPGSGGGDDAGGRARAFGERNGWISLRAPDSRYERYFQRVRRTLDSLWADAFPHDEALQLHQGRVILHFVIAHDGSVRDVSVQIRSGIPRFDRNVRDAVAAAHLPPIPADLRMEEIRVTAPFVFRNPIVR